MIHFIDVKPLVATVKQCILLIFIITFFCRSCESKIESCVTRVGCYSLMVKHPKCGNGTINYDTNDYTVELLIKGCKGKNKNDIHIAWHETLDNNEDVEFEECRNKKSCSFKQTWLQEEPIHIIRIWIHLTDLHKVIKMPVKLAVGSIPTQSKNPHKVKVKKLLKNKKLKKKTVKKQIDTLWGKVEKPTDSTTARPYIKMFGQKGSNSFLKIISHENLVNSVKDKSGKIKVNQRDNTTAITKEQMQAPLLKASINSSTSQKETTLLGSQAIGGDLEVKAKMKNVKTKQFGEHRGNGLLRHVKKGNEQKQVVHLFSSPKNWLAKYCIVMDKNGQKHVQLCPTVVSNLKSTSYPKDKFTSLNIKSHEVQGHFHPFGTKHLMHQDKEVSRYLLKTKLLLSFLKNQNKLQIGNLICEITNSSLRKAKMPLSPHEMFKCWSVNNRTQIAVIDKQKEDEKLLKEIKQSVLLLMKEFNVTQQDLKQLQAASKKSAMLLLQHLTAMRKISQDGGYLPAKVGQLTADVLQKLYNNSYLATKRALNESHHQHTSNVHSNLKIPILHVISPHWGTWNPWMPCSLSCGIGGTHQRERVCLGSSKALQCKGKDKEITPCHYKECPGSVKWSTWGAWTKCSATCGHAYTTRSRSCIITGKSNEACVGMGSEFKACKMKMCQPHAVAVAVPMVIRGYWSTWGTWTHCPVTCGLGQEIRKRTCERPLKAMNYPTRKLHCAGKSTSERPCIMSSCDLAPEVHEVLEGHDAVLRCAIDEGLEPDQIYWVTPQGRKITRMSNFKRYELENGYLTVKNAQRYDKGVYHCVMSSSLDQELTADSMIEVTTCNSNPCQNGASCIEDKFPDDPHHHHIQCICQSGFQGLLCEQSTSISTNLALIISLSVAGCILIILGVVICFQCYRQRLRKSKKTTQTDFSDSKTNISGKKNTRASSKSSCKKPKTKNVANGEIDPLLHPAEMDGTQWKKVNTSVVSSDDSFIEINQKDFENEQYLFDMYKNKGIHANSTPVFPTTKPSTTVEKKAFSMFDRIPQTFSVQHPQKSRTKKSSKIRNASNYSDKKMQEKHLESDMGLYEDVVTSLSKSKLKRGSSVSKDKSGYTSHDPIYENVEQPHVSRDTFASDVKSSSKPHKDSKVSFLDKDFEMYHTMGAQQYREDSSAPNSRLVAITDKDVIERDQANDSQGYEDFQVVHRSQHSRQIDHGATDSTMQQMPHTTSFNQNNYSVENDRSGSYHQGITRGADTGDIKRYSDIGSPYSLNLGDLLDNETSPVNTELPKKLSDDNGEKNMNTDPGHHASKTNPGQHMFESNDLVMDSDNIQSPGPNISPQLSPRTRMCMDHYQMVYGPLAYKSPRSDNQDEADLDVRQE